MIQQIKYKQQHHNTHCVLCERGYEFLKWLNWTIKQFSQRQCLVWTVKFTKLEISITMKNEQLDIWDSLQNNIKFKSTTDRKQTKRQKQIISPDTHTYEYLSLSCWILTKSKTTQMEHLSQFLSSEASIHMENICVLGSPNQTHCWNFPYNSVDSKGLHIHTWEFSFTVSVCLLVWNKFRVDWI